jgi:hypothetical protein
LFLGWKNEHSLNKARPKQYMLGLPSGLKALANE